MITEQHKIFSQRVNLFPIKDVLICWKDEKSELGEALILRKTGENMRRDYAGRNWLGAVAAVTLIVTGVIAEPLLAVLGLLMLAVDVIISVVESMQHGQEHMEQKKEKEGKAFYESIGDGRKGPVRI